MVFLSSAIMPLQRGAYSIVKVFFFFLLCVLKLAACVHLAAMCSKGSKKKRRELGRRAEKRCEISRRVRVG